MPRTKQKKTSEEKEKVPKPAKSPKVPKSPKPEPTTEEVPKPSEVAESPKPELGIEKTTLPSKQAEAEPAKGVSEKVVFVGQKPVKNYVMACITSFSAGSNKIVLKARGRAICKAVDTAELLRRTFMKNAQLQGISISTEQVTREGDRKTNVSTIEISITRQ
ncbi:MAG: DNA-binding protein Alba [Candidatus Bathyarchaeia archaeon]|jgi:DNA-binding protein